MERTTARRRPVVHPRRPSGGSPTRRREDAPNPTPDPPPRDRFRHLDTYRVQREWSRYEGTPTRDLYRTLRERFLGRHAAMGAVALEVGPGPGRFTSRVGTPGSRKVLLDLSRAMLREVPRRHRGDPGLLRSIDLVEGDAAFPPFRPGRFGAVVVLGNVVGFGSADAETIVRSVADQVAPGGRLLLELAAGPGERSRYLTRLPPGAVARLFRSPLRWLEERIGREGFTLGPPSRGTRATFRVVTVPTAQESLRPLGFDLVEAVAVAPALGLDAERTAAVQRDPTSWARLLEVEERLGRRPDRWERAAAVLVSFERHTEGGPARTNQNVRFK